MNWNVTLKNAGIHGILFLLVFIVGPALTFTKFPIYRSPIDLENVSVASNNTASASTVEILRNMQSVLSITRPLGTRRKAVKQEDGDSQGSANALAYLTDSFGGQLAGQVLSLILSSVTGDVRGILGNSLNLFQSDERRDQVQLFLDDLSQNFLKFTGLGLLVTTKSPLQQSTPYPGAPVLLGSGSGLGGLGGLGGQTQLQGLQTSQSIPVSSFGGATGGVPAFPPASASGAGGIASLGASAGLQQRPAQQGATAAGQQPIIYVLPQLANGGQTGTGGTKAGGRVTTASTNSGDDDSEEERRLWSA